MARWQLPQHRCSATNANIRSCPPCERLSAGPLGGPAMPVQADSRKFVVRRSGPDAERSQRSVNRHAGPVSELIWRLGWLVRRAGELRSEDYGAIRPGDGGMDAVSSPELAVHIQHCAVT